MILLLLSIVYAVWFFKSAKAHGGRNPNLWAAAGLGGFFVPAFLTSLGLRLMLAGFVTGEYWSVIIEGLSVAAFMLTAAFAVGNGLCLMLWRVFLSPPSSALSLWGQMRERRSLALPGRFPAGFASGYAMVCVLGLMLLMISQPFFYWLAEISQHVGPLFYTHCLSIVLYTAGLSVLFWRTSDWRAVAGVWGLLTALSVFLKQLISLLAVPIPLPISMLMFTFTVQFAAGFAVAAIVLFCVRQRGAGFVTLAGSFILSHFVLGFLLALPQLFLVPDPRFFLYEVTMNLLWTIFAGLALATGFLFQGGGSAAGAEAARPPTDKG